MREVASLDFDSLCPFVSGASGLGLCSGVPCEQVATVGDIGCAPYRNKGILPPNCVPLPY